MINSRRKTESAMSKTEETQAVIPPPAPKSMSQEEEIAYYEKMVASIPSGVKDQLPQTLQSKDALFLFLLLQEGGFLDNELKPAIRKEDGEINQTLYAYIADAVCTALNIRQGKWKIFEKLWPINNGTQTVSRYKQETKDASTQYQKQIARMLRKATRIRPGLDTYDLQYFKGHRLCQLMSDRLGQTYSLFPVTVRKWRDFLCPFSKATPRRIPLYSHAGLFGVYGVFTVPL